MGAAGLAAGAANGTKKPFFPKKFGGIGMYTNDDIYLKNEFRGYNFR